MKWIQTNCSHLSCKRSPDLSSFPRQTAVSPSEAAPGLLSLSNNCRGKSFMENCITLHNYNTLCATICHPPKSPSDKWFLSLLQYKFNNNRLFSESVKKLWIFVHTKGSDGVLTPTGTILFTLCCLLVFASFFLSFLPSFFLSQKDHPNTNSRQNLNNDEVKTC